MHAQRHLVLMTVAKVLNVKLCYFSVILTISYRIISELVFDLLCKVICATFANPAFATSCNSSTNLGVATAGIDRSFNNVGTVICMLKTSSTLSPACYNLIIK